MISGSLSPLGAPQSHCWGHCLFRLTDVLADQSGSVAGDSVNCWGDVLKGSSCLVLTHRDTRSRVQSSLWGSGSSPHPDHPGVCPNRLPWLPLNVRGLARGEPGNRPRCELFESRNPVLKPVWWGHWDVLEASSEPPPSSMSLWSLAQGVAVLPCNDLSVPCNDRVTHLLP